jgi:hypothetical protein
MPPAYPARNESCARDGVWGNPMGNDNLVAKRIGPLAHDGSYGLSCGHVLMRAAIMPNFDRLVVCHSEVDSKNSSPPPFTEFTYPLMGHHVVGSDRKRKHARIPEASDFRFEASSHNATQQFGRCEVDKSSHTSSICSWSARVKQNCATWGGLLHCSVQGQKGAQIDAFANWCQNWCHCAELRKRESALT